MKLKDLNKVEMGKRIRICRENLGYSQEKLAMPLDITPKFIKDIESGGKGLSLQNFTHLIQVLQVSGNYLLLGEIDSGQPKLICEVRYYIK